MRLSVVALACSFTLHAAASMALPSRSSLHDATGGGEAVETVRSLVRLDPDHEPAPRGLVFRKPPALPVRWDP